MKFIDLYDPIMEHFEKAGADAKDVLEWLDNHAELPGRTVTESELRRIAEDSAGPGASTVMPYIKATVEALSITIVPDPEPTNAEKWEAFILKMIRGNPQWDSRTIAEAIDEAGVKAPGGDDE